MSAKAVKKKLHTHHSDVFDFKKKINAIQDRLLANGDTAVGPLVEKLEFLKQISQFDYGRFLIMNGGVNGRWSHYLFYEYPFLKNLGTQFHPLEFKMLNSALMKSNRERIPLIQSILKTELFDGMSMLSVPCGVMAELLSIDYSRIKNFTLTGVDLDPESLVLAQSFSKQCGLEFHCNFYERDAWNLDFENEFDYVLSIGLNMYSPNLETAMNLYRSLYKTVKKGGKLLISFVTPDISTPNSERDPKQVFTDEIKRALLMEEILQIKFNQHLATSDQITQYLKECGFLNVICHYSTYRAFNIAVATK